MAETSGTVQLTEVEYKKLLEKKETVQSALALVDDFRAWLLAEKGTGDLEAGLRLCSTAELWEWMQKCYRPLGWYMPMSMAEAAASRVLAYEAAELQAREAERSSVPHIDPWEGR